MSEQVTVESASENPNAFSAAARRFRGDVDVETFIAATSARGFAAQGPTVNYWFAL